MDYQWENFSRMAVLDLQLFSESRSWVELGHAYHLLKLFVLQEDIALTLIVLTKLKLLQA